MRSDQLVRDEDHVYTHEDTVLTSVTKFIKSHWPSFDPDGIRWDGSTYAQGTAEYVREEIRGMGPVTKKYQDPFHYCKKLFGESWEEEVERRSQKKVPINAREVKKYWELKGALAAEEGTRIHDLIERVIEEDISLDEYMDEPLVVAAVNFYNELQNKNGYILHPYAELQVFSLELGLAGTIDLCLVKGDEVILVDWKTNNSLTRAGYSKGLTPATALISDGNLNLYELQLSLYAYILEKEFGLTPYRLYIFHLDTPQTCESIEVEYKKELIEEMLIQDGRL